MWYKSSNHFSGLYWLSEHFSTKHLPIARTSALAAQAHSAAALLWTGRAAQKSPSMQRLLRLGLNHLNPWILVYQETSHIRDVWQAIWDIPIFVNGHESLVVNQLYELMFCYNKRLTCFFGVRPFMSQPQVQPQHTATMSKCHSGASCSSGKGIGFWCFTQVQGRNLCKFNCDDCHNHFLHFWIQHFNFFNLLDSGWAGYRQLSKTNGFGVAGRNQMAFSGVFPYTPQPLRPPAAPPIWCQALDAPWCQITINNLDFVSWYNYGDMCFTDSTMATQKINPSLGYILNCCSINSNSWWLMGGLGWWFGYLGSPLWKGLLLRGRPYKITMSWLKPLQWTR